MAADVVTTDLRRRGLRTFQSYRDRLLGAPVPQSFELVVWLQGMWETLANAGIVTALARRAKMRVLILGNDERIHEDLAPTVAEMESALPSEFDVSATPTMNTLEQAQAFWARKPEPGATYAIVTAFTHVVRASLTFEFHRMGGARLCWTAHRPNTSVRELNLAARTEMGKIVDYAQAGHCYRLAEAPR